MKERRRFGRLTVDLSNTNKAFFPDEGITKGEAVGYYQEIASRMLPHLRGLAHSDGRGTRTASMASEYFKECPRLFSRMG